MTVCLKSSLTQSYIWPDQIWIRSLTSDRKVITTLEKSLQGKESQIQQLEKQLADMSHLHQTEIVKLRLEFDEKILKLQRERNNAKAQAGQSFNANTDIFRKKLQFAKAEAQKEINSLKSQVAELERKLTMRQMPASKRKLFWHMEHTPVISATVPIID